VGQVATFSTAVYSLSAFVGHTARQICSLGPQSRLSQRWREGQQQLMEKSMINVGDKMPSMTLKRIGANGMEEVATDDLFKGKVVLFSVPGAFTPTCSMKHLPGFVALADAFKEKGVDRIVCFAVNDAFVMKAWGDQNNVAGKVEMLPDGNGDLTRALDLEMDGTGFGLGKRSKRFALLIEDGIVKDVQIEKPGAFEVSSAEAMLSRV
jgi:peroxiredoxin